MATLVGVEIAEGVDKGHPVGFVTKVGVWRGDRDGAKVGSYGGKRAAGKSAVQMRVLLEKCLLGGVVVCEDGVTQHLKVR
jgi:hypothetical protein